MRLFSDLYWGPKALAQKEMILGLLRRRADFPGIYLITRAVDSDGLMDIYKLKAFYGKRIREADPLVLGIASGRPEALELSRQIVDELYHRKGDFDIDAFCDSGNP